MARFIGRKDELKALNDLYDAPGFQMSVIYGRRRTGKSTLIKEFIKSRRAVYFLSVRGKNSRNMERWGLEIKKAFEPDRPGIRLETFEDIADYLDYQCKGERTVVIIDELPYMAEDDDSFLSELQNAIDEKWINGQMMLLLCGSSISFMVDSVLGEKSPLFGRRTGQMEIKPFNYLESAEFVPGYSPEDKAIVYGITGGVAKYLSLIDEELSLDENIIRQFFSKSGYLYEEPVNLLQQEYRNVNLYCDIIQAMADGAGRINDIADKTHNDPTAVSHAMPGLIKTGIAEKEMCITDEDNKKKTHYVIADQMFRFWYKFVPDGMSAIELGYGEAYYKKAVKPRLHEYMGEVFEHMCRCYTLICGLNESISCFVTVTGKWWGTNPDKRESTDIDVVGLDTISRKAVIGECKFKNEPLDKQVYLSLLERDHLLGKNYTVIQYLLFSLSGFSEWIIENSAALNLKLITLEDMYKLSP